MRHSATLRVIASTPRTSRNCTTSKISSSYGATDDHAMPNFPNRVRRAWLPASGYAPPGVFERSAFRLRMRGNCIAAGLAQMPVQNASSHVERQSYTLAARAPPGVDDGIFRPANSCSGPIHPDRLGVSPLFYATLFVNDKPGCPLWASRPAILACRFWPRSWTGNRA